MNIQFKKDLSRGERLKRDLRHPSPLSFGASAVVVALIAAAIFGPGWFKSASEGIGSVTEVHDLTRASTLPEDDLEAHQIVPWMDTQTRKMINATGPLDWKVVNFRFGPCAPKNLEAMSAGAFVDSVTNACASLSDIQGRYTRDCFIAASCNIPESAKTEINGVMTLLWSAQADAGYERP